VATLVKAGADIAAKANVSGATADAPRRSSPCDRGGGASSAAATAPWPPR